jgi:hypothetical protein
MQRGVSPRRKIELLFEVLTEVLADLHSARASRGATKLPKGVTMRADTFDREQSEREFMMRVLQALIDQFDCMRMV